MTCSKSAGGGRAPVRYSRISVPWLPAGAAPTFAVRCSALAAPVNESCETGRVCAWATAEDGASADVSGVELTGRRGETGELRTSMGTFGGTLPLDLSEFAVRKLRTRD